MNKVGRNNPCWCKSGIKFKKCHYPTQPSQVINSFDPNTSLGEFGTKALLQDYGRVSKMSPQEIQQQLIHGKNILRQIKQEKESGTRPLPSQKCILGKNCSIPRMIRAALLDIVANITDFNPLGRSDMCIYSAILIADALRKMGFPANIQIGKATYYNPHNKDDYFTWDHGWVIMDDELIDGNVDSMTENPAIPIKSGINPLAYWGKLKDVPKNRTFSMEKEIDDDWIRKNTDYEILKVWRKVLYKELPRLVDIKNYKID